MNRIVGWGSADVLRTWSSLTRHSSLDEARLQQSKMERRKTLDSVVQAGGFVSACKMALSRLRGKNHRFSLGKQPQASCLHTWRSI